MKQNNNNNNMFGLFTSDDLEVAPILLELTGLIPRESDTARGFTVSWGTRKKRSVLTPSQQLTPSPSPLVPAATCVAGEKAADVAGSPNTPLLFAPVEADEKCIISSRTKRPSRRRLQSLSPRFPRTPPRKSVAMPAVDNEDHRNQQPLMAHRTVTEAGINCSYRFDWSSSSPGYPQPLDMGLNNSMAAALARQRRKLICKYKNSRASNKLICAFRR